MDTYIKYINWTGGVNVIIFVMITQEERCYEEKNY